MKKIDYTMSEKSIKRRPRADNTKICVEMNDESYPSPARY
jgi:hypothetical protein